MLPVEEFRTERWRDMDADPDLKAFNLAYNAELPLEDVTLYSFSTYGERDAEAANYFRLPTGTAAVPEVFPDGYFPLNNIKERLTNEQMAMLIGTVFRFSSA